MLIKNQKGLTMLEMLLVFALVAIIFSMSFSSYRTWQRQVLLTNIRDEIKSALVRAQQLATAADNNTAWGMHLATSSYTIFPGDYYDELDPNNKTWVLNGVEIVDSYITFADGAGGYSSDVVFSKFDGDTYNTGTVNIIIPIEAGLSKSVTVQSSGQID
ncbi:MAG: prepilin-type N-terminal cleavage/methylation domain-containing protein [Patescibacteria group bacterium]|jgi:type II secretory pathway pseudopilin PulG